MTAAPPRAHVLSAGEGDGPCAVFVHGIEDGWRAWQPLAASLGPRWRSIALDLPWRSGNDYCWRWAASPAEWVRAGLDALGDSPVVLVGHSFGANAVLGRLAASEPRAVAAVLAAPSFRPPDVAVTWRVLELSRQAFERQIRDGMRARLRGAADPDVFELMLARTYDRIGPVGFLAVFEAYVASGHLPLSNVDLPTLIVVGERDPSVHRPHLEALERWLPRATLTCGPDLDHFCHIDRPADLARQIEALAAPVVAPAGHDASP